VNLVPICIREWEQKKLLSAAPNLLPHSLTPQESLHTLFTKQISPDRFTSTRESFGTTPSKNQLLELENHGVELYQTSPNIVVLDDEVTANTVI
jgi:hypothetical protein